MKNRTLSIIIFIILTSLACQTLIPVSTEKNVDTTPTQKTVSSTLTAIPPEVPAQEDAVNNMLAETLQADYFLINDAYNVTYKEDGSIEFYTNMPFDEIGEYYLNELPLHGYSQVYRGGPRAVEGCYQIFFKGDPGGKTLIVMPCIVFQTEEHWVSISLEDN